MPKLPVISGKELISILQTFGFRIIRQKGSHVSMQKEQFKTVVPLHHELARGTLLGIMKQCGLTREDLITVISKKN